MSYSVLIFGSEDDTGTHQLNGYFPTEYDPAHSPIDPNRPLELNFCMAGCLLALTTQVIIHYLTAEVITYNVACGFILSQKCFYLHFCFEVVGQLMQVILASALQNQTGKLHVVCNG